MLFKKFRQKVKTINQMIKFANVVEDFIKNHSDKIEEVIKIIRQLADIIPGAKEQAESIINYLKEQLQTKKGKQ